MSYIEIYKSAYLTPDSLLGNPFVGSDQVFRMAHFYGKTANTPDSHPVHLALIRAFEICYAAFYPKFGVLAKPFIVPGGGFRAKADRNYFVGNDPKGGISEHSKGNALDPNWHSDVEDQIVLTIIHDIRIKGRVYQALREAGISEFGLYFNSPWGTFIHFGVSDTVKVWDKTVGYEAEAKQAWNTFYGTSLQSEYPSSKLKKAKAASSHLKTIIKNESGEDHFLKPIRWFQWILFGLGLSLLIVSSIILFRRYGRL